MSDPSYPAHENPAPRPIVAVIGIVIRDGKVLLVQRANPPDAGRWGFPGGKIELGERIMDAAARAIKEETAITVKPLDVLRLSMRWTTGRRASCTSTSCWSPCCVNGRPASRLPATMRATRDGSI